MDPSRNMMEEIFKMTKENNKMLHAMRRRAFIGGILKFVIWMMLIFGPIWFYMTYFNDDVQKILKTFDSLQGESGALQQNYSELQQTLKNLQSMVPGMGDVETAAAKPAVKK